MGQHYIGGPGGYGALTRPGQSSSLRSIFRAQRQDRNLDLHLELYVELGLYYKLYTALCSVDLRLYKLYNRPDYRLREAVS